MNPLIYALKDPATGVVRYVGKSVDPVKRLREHQCEARNPNSHTRKSHWLRSLAATPTIEILETVEPGDDWVGCERRWIARYRAEGVDLVNYTDGGEGWPHAQGHTEETKAKLREAAIARGARPPSQSGVKASAETRAKLSAARKAAGVKPPPRGGWNKGFRKTHCAHGHELTSENRYYRDGRYRGCRMCIRGASKRRAQDIAQLKKLGTQ